MDLSLVKKKINEGKYKSIHDAADDVRMIWKNCMTYNADGSDFYNLAQVSSCVLIGLVVVIKFMFITHLMSTFSHILYIHVHNTLQPPIDNGQEV